MQVLSNEGTVTTSGIRALASNDDTTYSEIGISIGSNKALSCYSLSLGSGKIKCVFNNSFNAQYFKLIVTSDFSNTNIYEVEITGK